MPEKFSHTEPTAVIEETECGAIERFLSRAEVRTLTGLSATTIWREIRAGRFPAPVVLSPNRKGFRAHDVAQWMRSRSKGLRDREQPPQSAQVHRKTTRQDDPDR